MDEKTDPTCRSGRKKKQAEDLKVTTKKKTGVEGAVGKEKYSMEKNSVTDRDVAMTDRDVAMTSRSEMRTKDGDCHSSSDRTRSILVPYMQKINNTEICRLHVTHLYVTSASLRRRKHHDDSNISQNAEPSSQDDLSGNQSEHLTGTATAQDHLALTQAVGSSGSVEDNTSISVSRKNEREKGGDFLKSAPSSSASRRTERKKEDEMPSKRYLLNEKLYDKKLDSATNMPKGFPY
ncbi:uncharacterized protein LOC106175464 isoform X2 [Lingula anatina]|uniref:Uncharacterized protein LOC106175464 isoform X2 n=1 Tax=Lingula anatina TaxID=7574 RepID=A0A1S3JSF1_LINAN|nr:uncharacterized protein LOC106175464 isoform X2 [Lingula anatina]|eukprot:XP_013412944.1 uncharacterized protein LOC106175464 isoform X2 [Lingula anatina]